MPSWPWLRQLTVAQAYDFPPVKPLDVKAVSSDMLADIYGEWEIRNRAGTRRCRIALLREPRIGGNRIKLPPDCAKAFPILGEITAWRLLEGWSIDLVDALRKTRMRFETPDERYVAFGEKADIVGMDEFRFVKAARR